MARLRVRVTPRGGVDAVDGWTDDGALRVRVRAAPADGAANDALLRVLARELRVPVSTLAVASGATARIKTVTTPLDEPTLAERLPTRQVLPGSAAK